MAIAQRPDLQAMTQRVVAAVLSRRGLLAAVGTSLAPGGTGAPASAADLLAMQQRLVARIAPGAAPTPSPPAPSPTPGKAPKLTGLKWHQKYPIGTNSKFVIPVGYLEVIGGIGPFLFVYSDPSRKYAGKWSDPYGILYTTEQPVGSTTDTLTAYVLDGRGDKSPVITFTIQKADGDGAGINSPLTLPAFAPVWSGRTRTDVAPLFTSFGYGPNHGDTRQDGVSVSDPKGVWAGSGPNIWSPKGLPPVGSYPITGTVTNSGSKVATPFAETLTIIPTPDVVSEFTQTAVWTDQTPVGTDIGFLAATVPDNGPVFVPQTPYFTVTDKLRVITAGKPPVGDLALPYLVVSGGDAINKLFTAHVTVLKGTALAPTDMSLALNKLDNSTPGQTVGQLAVKGRTGGKYTVLAQSGYNPNATTGQWGNPARYQVNGTQVVTPPDCLLSWQDPACGWEDDRITVVWTSDDGLTSCQQTFTVPVTEPAKVVTLTATDKASLHAANLSCRSPHPGVKYRVEVHYNPDPDAYTDATRGTDTQNGWVGPVDIVFLPGPNGEPVRLGGKADNTGVSSGITSYGKGYLLASTGDVRLIGAGKVSCVHGSSSSAGVEGIRKDGNTYGNLSLFNIAIEDCDQGLESGVCHGYIYAQGISVRRNGGASVGAGLTHGFYIGTVSKFELVDSYVDGTPWGHLIKCRARQTILRRNKVIDSGAAACCLDLPNGGDVLLEDNLFVKGPFATNPSVINFGAEGPSWDVNRLALNRNTIVGAGISYGGNYGPIVAVAHYHLPGTAPSTVSGTDNKVWLSAGGQASADLTNYTVPGTTQLTGTTILTAPPQIPALPPLSTRPYRWRMILDSQQEFANFNGVLVLASAAFPSVAAPGKVVTLTPTGDVVAGADPFAAGWTSAISQDRVYNQTQLPGPPWAPASAFSMSGGDLIYNGGLAPGLYFVQPQFTSTDGKTVANHRVAVTVR